MFLKRWSPALTISLSLISALPAFAAAEMTLYRGEAISSSTGQSIRLGGWGSGYALETQEQFFSGGNAIKLHTDGYYAGGRIDFTPATDLADAFADPNGYLVLTLRFPALEADEETIGDPRGGRPAGLFPGVGASGTSSQTGPKVAFLRVVAVVNGINLVAEDQPIDVRRTESGWTTVAIPLAAFKGPRPAGRALLSRLLIYGDRPDDFFVGELRTAIDDDEIVLEEEPEEQTVSPEDPLQLTATANGGLASLEYIWDFDKTDGLQEDAYGETASHTWHNPGAYIVTLRVRDINGVKPEFHQEFHITVTQ